MKYKNEKHSRNLEIRNFECCSLIVLYENKNKQTSVINEKMDVIKLHAYLLLVFLLQFLLPHQRSVASIKINQFTQRICLKAMIYY